MLQEAIDLQDNAVSSLFEQTDAKSEITFKAPTGSGKTYMMANFMNQVLETSNDVVFLVSTLSKGNLAQQNYKKFCEYRDKGDFPNLKPYLISSEISGEEGLFIPAENNVYVLPRDLYKKGGRLMQGAMENFLTTLTIDPVFGGCGKEIYLIKDECHIDTKNLDNLSITYFTKVFNFSATPNLRRGQNPDVEIKEEDAVNTKLIKAVTIGDDSDELSDAIEMFENIKDDYRNKLGVNPCLIIQISNKDKADEQLNNIIFPELNKAEHQDLKWMLIVDKDKDCDTNDVFKAKKIPVSKWKDYAKENTSGVDIIIFKLAISEGWDIPRACMLYQIRDTSSKQLDEQVLGRIRRNPRLLDYETLSTEAQRLAITAWVWGMISEDRKKSVEVRLRDSHLITNEIKLKTTRLKDLTQKQSFNIVDYLRSQPQRTTHTNIFTLNRKFNAADESVKKIGKDYAVSITKWLEFAENVDAISSEYKRYVCDYETSMKLTNDEDGNIVTASFPFISFYVDNGNYVKISDWVWARKDEKKKFSFDSEAEKEWAEILKDLVDEENDDDEEAIKNASPSEDLYLWGKNYISGSEIKFEYYLDGTHFSYPDFIMKDGYDRIHIFEVKSVNQSGALPINFDSEAYKNKINELKKCYKQASKLTGHAFYLPILKNDEWQITQLVDGQEKNITEDQFTKLIKKRP